MILTKNDTVAVGRAASFLVVVASLNALTSIVFASADVLAAPSDPNAGYALVRTIVLAVALVVAVSRRSATAIMVSGIALTLAQAGDAAVGFVDGSLATAIGPLAIALATFVCLVVFVRTVRSGTSQQRNRLQPS
jgi:hypothetical protein